MNKKQPSGVLVAYKTKRLYWIAVFIYLNYCFPSKFEI